MRSILPVVVSNAFAGQIRHVLAIIYIWFNLSGILLITPNPHCVSPSQCVGGFSRFCSCRKFLKLLGTGNASSKSSLQVLTVYSTAPHSPDRQESTTVMEFCTNFTDNIVFSLVIQCDGTRKNNMKPSRVWTAKWLTFWNDMATWLHK